MYGEAYCTCVGCYGTLEPDWEPHENDPGFRPRFSDVEDDWDIERVDCE